MPLVSVILSGGAGSRLWPISRQAFPKPFMKIGGSTLLQQAIERGRACGTDNTMVVTNEDHLFLSRDIFAAMPNVAHPHYLLETDGRNTAPAIALAALACTKKYGPDVVMLVLPADHLIPDTSSFVACALEAAHEARKGQLVIFGISPISPDTAFGYIEVEKISRDSQKVLKFVEKPDFLTAQHYLSTGCYYWNSGMFCFTARTVLQAFEKHSPEILDAANHAWCSSKTLDDITRFDSHTFGLQPDISIDYAIMERASNVVMVPARFGWSDVGSWPSMAQAHSADTNGNTFESVDDNICIVLETKNTHIHTDGFNKKVVAAIGVEDLVIVDTPDALLVLHKSAAQKVKTVVTVLKERLHESTLIPALVNRPWGNYTTLMEGNDYKVKRIVVKPGQALSLQYHRQRSEHWVVVQGTGRVQIGDHEHDTPAGGHCYIPLNENHRLTNYGTDELVLIEVQCGDYLDEKDIVRLADVYGRV